MIQAHTELNELQQQLRTFIARRVAAADEVDDVLQEVLLRMHRGLPSLHNQERLGAWLYRLARNAIVDHHRHRTRQLGRLQSAQEDDLSSPWSTPQQELAEIESDAAGVHADADVDRSVAREVAGYLRAFVRALPEPYRTTLMLTELDGLSQSAAASELGITLTATKARVRRGRAMLRERLEACCAIGLDARGKVVACTPRDDGSVPPECCS